jgi:hypothetical protein
MRCAATTKRRDFTSWTTADASGRPASTRACDENDSVELHGHNEVRSKWKKGRLQTRLLLRNFLAAPPSFFRGMASLKEKAVRDSNEARVLVIGY